MGPGDHGIFAELPAFGEQDVERVAVVLSEGVEEIFEGRSNRQHAQQLDTSQEMGGQLGIVVDDRFREQ